MKKIKAAIAGYGNIGRYVSDALETSPDFEIAGIIRRNAKASEIPGRKVVESVYELERPDVVILCTPSRNIENQAKEILAAGINTVDSFDIHAKIADLRDSLDAVAKKSGACAIVSAGWDPGSDSIVRALLLACAPKGITYTNFGPGMSMGHSTAVKAMDGVKDALSVTIPVGTGIHRRMVYVEVEPDGDFEKIKKAVKADEYFVNDDTQVFQVNSTAESKDTGHGVNLVRKGVSGKTQNQRFEFNMSIDNPALTAQIMVSAARASTKQKPGAYTMIEIPIIDMLYGERSEIIKSLV